jgi:ribosomal-protein-alanine N-acetyltransferase
MQNNRLMEIRKVRQTDRRQINNLLKYGSIIHRHFDWQSPLELIDYQPFYIAEWKYKLVAALACPPDPVGVVWIRFFAVESEISIAEAWKVLWAEAYEQFNDPELVVAAIPMQKWFQKILSDDKFEHITDVITLSWEGQLKPFSSETIPFRIRPMQYSDIPAVLKVDTAAFDRIWRNSRQLLEIALSKSAIATVVESPEGIIGYQISTASSSGGHLARLAVLPEWQGYGVGHHLVSELINQFMLWGTQRVTVNTQKNNHSSLALYKKIGFQQTNEIYPVYKRIYKLEMRNQ